MWRSVARASERASILAALDGSNGFRLDGVDAGDHSARSSCSAGDVDGDGFEDRIVGSAFAYLGGSTVLGELMWCSGCLT